MDPALLESLERDCELDVAMQFASLASGYLTAMRSDLGPVSTPHTPAELAARFDEPLPREGRPVEEIVARVRSAVMSDINRLAHPMAMGHQVSPPLAAAVWMDSVISAMNQSLAVAEMSPTGTAVEMQVIRWMCGLAGFGDGAGGTITSGGTEATFAALLAARAAALPDVWSDGFDTSMPMPVVLCGEHAHYAVTRAVAQLGLGVRRAVAIPSRHFRMDVEALGAKLGELSRDGTPVMAVVATSGSTATGSFDDLEAIAGLCERHGVWLHVDGAHGASALFSERHRHRLRGIERARSLAWDPHKMMLMPLPVGMILVREERSLDAAFAQRAPYLFRGNGEARVVDQGVRSFLCSRRADALKLWVAIQRYGASGIGALYDRLCDTAAAFHRAVGDHPEFEPLHEPESNILCFRWIGRNELPAEELDARNLAAREGVNRSGGGWLTTTVLDGRRVLRVTIMNPRTRREHAERMLELLSTAAHGVRSGAAIT